MRIEYPQLSAQIIKGIASVHITPKTAAGIYSSSFLEDASNLAMAGHTVLVDCGKWVGRGRTIAEINPALRFNTLESNPENHRTKFIASELIYGDPNKRMQDFADCPLNLALRYQRGWTGLKLFGPANLQVLITSSQKTAKPPDSSTIEHPMEQVYAEEPDAFVISPEVKNTSKITIAENITVTDIEEIFVHARGGYIVNLFLEDSSGHEHDLRVEVKEGKQREFVINVITPQLSNMTDIYSPIVRHALNSGHTVVVNSKDPIIGTEYREFSAWHTRNNGHNLNIFMDDFHDPSYLDIFAELIKEFISAGIPITVEFGNRPPDSTSELKQYLDTEIKRHIQISPQARPTDQKLAYMLKP